MARAVRNWLHASGDATPLPSSILFPSPSDPHRLAPFPVSIKHYLLTSVGNPRFSLYSLDRLSFARESRHPLRDSRPDSIPRSCHSRIHSRLLVIDNPLVFARCFVWCWSGQRLFATVEIVNLDARQIWNWNWKGEGESKVIVGEIAIRGCRPRISRGVRASFATARNSPVLRFIAYCLLDTGTFL